MSSETDLTPKLRIEGKDTASEQNSRPRMGLLCMFWESCIFSDAAFSIIIEDPNAVQAVNEILHEFSEYIIGRMGIPYRQKKISIISIAVDAPQEKISALSGKIGRLSGVTAKAAYSK